MKTWKTDFKMTMMVIGCGMHRYLFEKTQYQKKHYFFHLVNLLKKNKNDIF